MEISQHWCRPSFRGWWGGLPQRRKPITLGSGISNCIHPHQTTKMSGANLLLDIYPSQGWHKSSKGCIYIYTKYIYISNWNSNPNLFLWVSCLAPHLFDMLVPKRLDIPIRFLLEYLCATSRGNTWPNLQYPPPKKLAGHWFGQYFIPFMAKIQLYLTAVV